MDKLSRNAKRKAQPQVVVVPPAETGKHDVVAIRTDDELRLSLSDFGPTISIKNGERTNQREGAEVYEVTAHVSEKNELVGWKIEKAGVTAGDNCTVFITAKKQRAPRTEERK